MNIVVATVFLALSCATIISGSSVDDSNNFEKTFKHRALIEELKEKTKCFDENISSTFKFMLEDAKIGIKSNKIQSQRPRLAMNYINLKTAQKEWFVTHDQFTRFEDELKICLKLYEYSSSQEKNSCLGRYDTSVSGVLSTFAKYLESEYPSIHLNILEMLNEECADYMTENIFF